MPEALQIGLLAHIYLFGSLKILQGNHVILENSELGVNCANKWANNSVSKQNRNHLTPTSRLNP